MALPTAKRVTKRVTVFSHYACPVCSEPLQNITTSWGTRRLCTEPPLSRTFHPCGCRVSNEADHLDANAAQ